LVPVIATVFNYTFHFAAGPVPLSVSTVLCVVKPLSFIAVPVSNFEKFRFRLRLRYGSGSRQYLAQFSNSQKFVQKSCISDVRSSIVSRNVGLPFVIFYFRIPFYVASAIPVPVPLRQKVAVPVRFHNTGSGTKLCVLGR
jgi:hypothetical protein